MFKQISQKKIQGRKDPGMPAIAEQNQYDFVSNGVVMDIKMSVKLVIAMIKIRH